MKVNNPAVAVLTVKKCKFLRIVATEDGDNCFAPPHRMWILIGSLMLIVMISLFLVPMMVNYT